MKPEVAVAEPEPVLAAECRDRLQRVPRLVRAPPAALVVVQPGEGVEHAVEVGGNAHPEHLDVVADVDDRRDVLAAERLDQSADELRAPNPAAENADVQTRTSRAPRVFRPTRSATRLRSSHVSTSSTSPGRSRRRAPSARSKRSALPRPYSGRKSSRARSAIAFVVPSRAGTIAGADMSSSSSSLDVTQGRSALTIATGPSPTAARAATTATPCPPGASATST